MKYIIGSTALKNIFDDFKREPKDIDFVVNEKTENFTDENGARNEHLLIPCLFSYIEKYGINKDVLYTLKVSHIFWDINWDKHMFDINFLLDKGAKLINPLFDELYLYWNKFHSENKRSRLNMSAKDFFDNALKTYDHDLLHTYINPRPTYFKVLKDGADVDVDENKFNNLSFDEKLDLVREEIYVMAFERLNERNFRVAYAWMLRKFIREHAPMWEALFIIENYKLLSKCQINYVKLIEEKLCKEIES